MALPSMPSFGCEHLNQSIVEEIQKVIDDANFADLDFAKYTCLSCPFTGTAEKLVQQFAELAEHFQSSTHSFAVSPKSVFCMQCYDLVFDPNISFQNNGGKKRKPLVRSKEDEEFVAANTLPKTCGRVEVRGLYNLGETCYMNAVLQVFVHNRTLKNYFTSTGHPLHTCPISKEPEKKNDSDDSDDEVNGDDKDQKTCVACAMTDLFSDISIIDQTLPAHSVNLLFASWKNIPDMAGKSQQDAQEWYTVILDKLHEAAINPIIIGANSSSDTFNTLNRVAKVNAISGKTDVRCPCIFHDTFFGQFQSKIICETCHDGKTDAKEEFSSLSLDFRKQNKKKKKEANRVDSEKSSSKDKSQPNAFVGVMTGGIGVMAPNAGVPNLLECLKAYTAPERLSAESYNCPKCKTGRAATKTLKIQHNPQVLAIHVKRFGMRKVNGVQTGMSEKYEGKLDFPLVLDMGPYTTAPVDDIVYGGPLWGKYLYDLDAVVVHQGDDSHSGHYYTYCRVGGRTLGRKTIGSDGYTIPSGKWYKFDDEIVSATTVEEVLRQEAYLLFYGIRDVFDVGRKGRQKPVGKKEKS